jgi:hypothetical protein
LEAESTLTIGLLLQDRVKGLKEFSPQRWAPTWSVYAAGSHRTGLPQCNSLYMMCIKHLYIRGRL